MDSKIETEMALRTYDYTLQSAAKSKRNDLAMIAVLCAAALAVESG
jgi:hypothetical protein